jgi:hypothetical protein
MKQNPPQLALGGQSQSTYAAGSTSRRRDCSSSPHVANIQSALREPLDCLGHLPMLSVPVHSEALLVSPALLKTTLFRVARLLDLRPRWHPGLACQGATGIRGRRRAKALAHLLQFAQTPEHATDRRPVRDLRLLHLCSERLHAARGKSVDLADHRTSPRTNPATRNRIVPDWTVRPSSGGRRESERNAARKSLEGSGRSNGGDGGIRTLDTPFGVCSFSKRVPSAARPRLRRPSI